MKKEIVLNINNLTTEIKGQVIHKKLNLDVYAGEIFGIIGASGGGKTVLFRTILGLLRPRSGKIIVFGENALQSNTDVIKQRCGVLFQSGALFSSLSVEENIMLPMRELGHIPDDIARDLARLKIQMVGLKEETLKKLPSELSGGMIKRVALARALAMDADLLLLDEPTAGLDPISAEKFDILLQELQESLNLTVIMITHDLDTLYTLCKRVGVLVDGRMIVDELQLIHNNDHPWIKSYFLGQRGRVLRKDIHGITT